MLRIAVTGFAIASFVLLGAQGAQACRVPSCYCLDADGGVVENDLVCCGAEALDVLDGVGEQQICGRFAIANPNVPFAEPIVELAGRISSEGIEGCGCLDADQDGTPEAMDTFPLGQDCARTAAEACLSGHQPPARQCATIFFNAPSCSTN